jgi:putative phosphoribosyl transferase
VNYTGTFIDRSDAGRRLARRLSHLNLGDAVVLGLPRGGVAVAAEVANALHLPLDVIVVRKLGLPFQSELAMGAIGEDGIRVMNDDVVQSSEVSESDIWAAEAHERTELERRVTLYRGNRNRVSIRGRTAVIVDDGVATGSSAKAACQVARAQGARQVVIAVPVAPSDWDERIGPDADLCVALTTPPGFAAVGQFYDHFEQATDADVTSCLRQSDERLLEAGAGSSVDIRSGFGTDRDVNIAVTHSELIGHLVVSPSDSRTAPAMVILVHGSGSSRLSPRNRFVASVLNAAGLGTLVIDLLTPDEEHDRTKVFDIEKLAHRLIEVTNWLRSCPGFAGCRVGYFGSSTGGAVALCAAANPGLDISAVVSRGGRPDLAAQHVSAVHCPTLFIVGANDDVVLDLTQRCQEHVLCPNELQVIPGASHLFEEPGSLEQVAVLARSWFVRHLVEESAGARKPVSLKV